MSYPIHSLLVVGASPGSIGEAVAGAAQETFLPRTETRAIGRVTTCGPRGYEDFWLDVRDDSGVRAVLEEVRPTHVVCTTGVNYFEKESENPEMGDWMRLMNSAMEINCTGILAMARHWSHVVASSLQLDDIEPASGFHFAAISSNSAHIPRSVSASYCASKAALSMGMRCLARDDAKAGMKTAQYVYEPGWVGGTPMSVAIAGNNTERTQARYHRIPSGLSIDRHDLARLIVGNLARSWNILNGSCIRLDGGDQ